VTTAEPVADIVRLGDSRTLADGHDLADGLRATPRRIPSHYGYDQRGSELFDAVTRLPEYFLTWVETELFEWHADDIIAATDTDSLVELGSGTARKTRILLAALMRRRELPVFRPVDISAETLRSSCQSITTELGLTVNGVAAPWHQGLAWLRENVRERFTLAFLGSGIGNMDALERSMFLSMVAENLRAGDRLLLTADLQKTAAEFERAYVDPPGSTVWARFRINRLNHLNELFGANFDLTRFYDNSVYNEATNTIESGLYSVSRQHIAIPSLGVDLDIEKGERIVVDYSVKFDRDELRTEVETQGFDLVGEWIHGPRQYGVFVFEKGLA
jgi:L-histidine Nalpha-methyltransferase